MNELIMDVGKIKMYELAKEMVAKGLMTVRKDGDLEIFCYSRDAFFGKNWNPVTLTHRGVIYHNGEMVNKPFEKIFNVGEVENTELDVVLSRMKNEKYEVLHKSNGHLLIASCFYDQEGKKRIVWSTKGSFAVEGNDLLNNDIELVKSNGLEEKIAAIFEDYDRPMTFMFEAIVQHDKHTMFEKDCEMYGVVDNDFILLGVYYKMLEYDGWKDLSHRALASLGKSRGITVVKKFERVKGELSDWYGHEGTEGYVIRFDNGDRVKVKTREYWALRFKKDLRPERIIGMFGTAGFDRIEHRLPEEVSSQCKVVITEAFVDWLTSVYVPLTLWHVETYVSAPCGSVVKDADLTASQKDRLFAMRKGQNLQNYAARSARSKGIRKSFVEDVLNTPSTLETISIKLQDIVDKIGS